MVRELDRQSDKLEEAREGVSHMIDNIHIKCPTALDFDIIPLSMSPSNYDVCTG